MNQNPIKGSHSSCEQETLPSLLSTGLLQERIWAWFKNFLKIASENKQNDWVQTNQEFKFQTIS